MTYDERIMACADEACKKFFSELHAGMTNALVFKMLVMQEVRKHFPPPPESARALAEKWVNRLPTSTPTTAEAELAADVAAIVQAERERCVGQVRAIRDELDDCGEFEGRAEGACNDIIAAIREGVST